MLIYSHDNDESMTSCTSIRHPLQQQKVIPSTAPNQVAETLVANLTLDEIDDMGDRVSDCTADRL
ncbi:hypothetical protein E2562_005546 [Oryza meyeriana var. granulata]|uniref:Uncharacterized protein n=1 Tax=Oryza meyeriana var. granulata TaxID=110450 RepID=A0A6G1F3X6_9ORYZ|nr:hypothetical protein E2562_005546 [Oryza meyeriana var. granulata]